jgi:hypothetical protein
MVSQQEIMQQPQLPQQQQVIMHQHQQQQVIMLHPPPQQQQEVMHQPLDSFAKQMDMLQKTTEAFMGGVLSVGNITIQIQKK